MDIMLTIDEDGHLECTLVDRDDTATIRAADPHGATADLEAALADAAEGGYGECLWPLTDGAYKWLFRRHDDTTDVVVIWSSGVITGWEHVFRSEIATRRLEARVADELHQLRAAR